MKTKTYLRYSCAFCGDRFRSRRQRTNHTRDCDEGARKMVEKVIAKKRSLRDPTYMEQ